MHALLVEKEVPIPLRDGGTVYANVFRPAEVGQFPAIMTLGPYPKDIPFSAWNPVAWEQLPERGEHTVRASVPLTGARRAPYATRTEDIA